jgi:hypothetical protein
MYFEIHPYYFKFNLRHDLGGSHFLLVNPGFLGISKDISKGEVLPAVSQ